MSVPRIVIAGTHSGVGKTTVATGIMAAFARRGLRVQAFKVGPDFIDPTFHRVATGRPSHNLDGWMLPRETNLGLFARATADADVAVIEGVMGMFDGKDGLSLAGTTAEIAMWLDAPVVLVLDASALAGSAAAIVHGFETLAPEVPVAAVLANKVAGAGHYEFLRQAIDARCHAKSVGWLPRDASLEFPSRHLGLHLAQETLTEDRLRELAECLEAHVDLDRLLALGAASQTLTAPAVSAAPPVRARIAVARDAAFCFYYQANLDLLRECGAELVAFSPILDSALLQGGSPDAFRGHANVAGEWPGGRIQYSFGATQTDVLSGFDTGVGRMFFNSCLQASATYVYTALRNVVGISRGVETSVAVAPTRILNITAAYSYIAVIERATSRLLLTFDIRQSSDYPAPVYGSYTTQVFQFDGIHKVNVGAGYSIPLSEFRTVRLYARTENSFNQTYFESGYPTPGRTARGGLQFDL